MRNAIMTWLELVGLALVSAGGGVEVARYSLAGGLATGGALLIGASALIGRRRPQ